MNTSLLAITKLDMMVSQLPEEDRLRFRRIFRVNKVVGYLEHPEAMHPWVEKQFGSLENVSRQEIVKITNLVTNEGALFNSIRSSRPMDVRSRLEVETMAMDESLNDPLNEPERMTSEDVFGRVKGKFCISASNIAKYDALHGLIIFDQHNPLRFDRERIVDYIGTGWRWAQRAHLWDPEAHYFLFIWNCLWKAGASLPHGHAQVVLARDGHYAKIEALRQAASAYRLRYGTNYFEDLYLAHLSVACATEIEGVKILSYLTPIKEKEVMLIGKEINTPFLEVVHDVLACLRDSYNVASFNLMLTCPPLDGAEPGWEDFPAALVRIVDRGNPRNNTCDIGAMELYASSVISVDPIEMACFLRECVL